MYEAGLEIIKIVGLPDPVEYIKRAEGIFERYGLNKVETLILAKLILLAIITAGEKLQSGLGMFEYE